MVKEGVLLGFSGGMDSSTAAERLLSEGYRVIALTIDTFGDESMLRYAREAAERIGIEWRSYDAQKEFRREVVDYFTSEYLAGRTPAPCTRCNTHIKWRILAQLSDELNIDHIATGHYFNIERRGDYLYVAKGADLAKDQSYYLWGLSQATLRRALTPMGSVVKEQIRERFDNRSESMGICFLKGQPYGDFLRSEGSSIVSGEVRNRQGEIVGKHDGIALYTIGQRRGNGISEGMRVVDIEADSNTLIVGSNSELYKSTLYIDHCTIVNTEELLNADDITVKIRGIGRNPEAYVRVSPHLTGYKVFVDGGAWAPAKGQPLVFYRNNLVIGGGIVVDFE
ncbi:MAG: tRNA-specific 2-thiouridylase [Alistipes sp.]|nr:tRNA-specific 2-thiouridylase [Alistipes sp.]